MLEAVIFIGIQASGKSTFYTARFFTTHLRLNLDMLKTRHRLLLLTRACLEAKQRFVLDNTHPAAADRAPYIAMARAAGFRVTGFYFEPDVQGSLRRNDERDETQRIPRKGIFGTLKRLEPPTYAEGFDELYCVRINQGGGFDVAECVVGV